MSQSKYSRLQKNVKDLQKRKEVSGMLENGMVLSAAACNYGYGWDDPWARFVGDERSYGYEDEYEDDWFEEEDEEWA